MWSNTNVSYWYVRKCKCSLKIDCIQIFLKKQTTKTLCSRLCMTSLHCTIANPMSNWNHTFKDKTTLHREPFNEERLATVQIERGSGKREITWMQAVIKAPIYCKHTFVTFKIVQHTCAQNKKQSTLSPMKSLSLPYSLFIQLWKVHERGIQTTIIFSFQHSPTTH